jgi:excisionase family DNA binding protein
LRSKMKGQDMIAADELPPVKAAGDALLVDRVHAARVLGVSPRTLWSLTQTGELPCRRVGRRCLYRPSDLERFAAVTGK